MCWWRCKYQWIEKYYLSHLWSKIFHNNWRKEIKSSKGFYRNHLEQSNNRNVKNHTRKKHKPKHLFFNVPMHLCFSPSPVPLFVPPNSFVVSLVHLGSRTTKPRLALPIQKIDPCLVTFKIPKLYKISHHIESLHACMNY